MQNKNSHIALLFFTIFALYSLQPLLLSSVKPCSGKFPICYQKVCHVQSAHRIKKWEQKKFAHNKAVQQITVSCETPMIATALVFDFEKTVSWATKDFFYKPDIHSPPYIQLITPPPIFS